MRKTETRKEIRTSSRRYSPIKHVKGSISGNHDVNIISIIHDSSETILIVISK